MNFYKSDDIDDILYIYLENKKIDISDIFLKKIVEILNDLDN